MQIRLKQNQKHMQYWKPSILGHILSKKIYLPVAAKILNVRIIVIFLESFCECNPFKNQFSNRDHIDTFFYYSGINKVLNNIFHTLR